MITALLLATAAPAALGAERRFATMAPFDDEVAAQ